MTSRMCSTSWSVSCDTRRSAGRPTFSMISLAFEAPMPWMYCRATITRLLVGILTPAMRAKAVSPVAGRAHGRCLSPTGSRRKPFCQTFQGVAGICSRTGRNGPGAHACQDQKRPSRHPRPPRGARRRCYLSRIVPVIRGFRPASSTSMRLFSLKNPVDGGADLGDRGHAVHRPQGALPAVVVDQGGGLDPVGVQALLEDVRIVVRPHGLAAGFGLGDAPLDARQQGGRIDLELDHAV